MASRRMVICIGVLLSVITRCHCVALSKVSSTNPPTMLKIKSRGNSTQIKTKEAQGPRGRLFIGRPSRQSATLKEHLDDADYQSDMGWDEAFSKAQADGAAKHGSAEVQKLMQTEPNVECTRHAMKLKAQGSFSTPGSLFMVDRGSSLPPVPLLNLPPSCGFTLNTTERYLVLDAPYDGCFISLEEEGYVLLLRWWGIPVRLSCPAVRPSRYNPPSVTCNTAGMVVKTEWASPVDKINVNLNGHWEPLVQVLPRCGFGFDFDSNPGSVAISIRYVPCVEVKDGMFSLGLAGDGAVNVSCPSIHVFDGQIEGVLPTVSPMRYQNLPPAGTSEGQKQDSIYQPAKDQVLVTIPPKNPLTPEGQPSQRGFNWPPHPSASQTSDPFPPYYQSPFYPHLYPFPYLTWPPHPPGSPDQSHRYYPNPFYPSGHDGHSQKPSSPTSKTNVQEPTPQPKPPKTHVDKNPVGQDRQNAWPYNIPLYFWPPQPSQSPDLLTPGDPQEPSSPNTEEQDPATQPKPTKTQVDRGLVIPEGKNPNLYQFPNFYRPPHLSAYPTPNQLQLQPYYPNPYYPNPPSGPDGHSQQPVWPTSKNEGQKPDTQSKQPKTDAVKNPVGQDGQTPWPYQFPYYLWHPQPSQISDLLTPGIAHKPSSSTSKTEGQAPPLETRVDKSPVAPRAKTPDIYPFPNFNWPPHPSAYQTPDQSHRYYPNPLYPPSGPDGHSLKPSSPTSKTDVQEPTPQPKPPKTHVDKNPVGQDGQNTWAYTFPLYFWPPQPSQSPDPLAPGDPQEPSSPITEEQEPATQPNPPKTQVDRGLVIQEDKKPNLYQFPNFYWPPHLSAYPTPDQLQSYYPNSFYPPSGPDGHLQNASSPTSKTDVQEPTPQPKPSKTQVNRTPVPVEGQNLHLYPFPYPAWPPPPFRSQAPDQSQPYYPNPFYPPSGPDGDLQNASLPTSKTDVQEPTPQPKPPKTQVDKNPVSQEGQNLKPFPDLTVPPHQFPPYFQNPFHRPPVPGGPSQKRASTAELQEPVTQPKPPETQVTRTPVPVEGQHLHLYPFPYLTWPPPPFRSEAPDQSQPYYPNSIYPPSGPDGHLQNSSSPTSKTDVPEPTPQPKSPKTQVNQASVPVEGQNPHLYPFPYLTWPPHPSGSQAPDPFPFYQNPFYRPDGTSHKNASSTSKTEVTTPKPPMSGVITDLPPIDALATVARAKPSQSESVLSYNPLVQCPQRCPSGLSQCCVTFNYHQHDHFIYPSEGDRKMYTFFTSLVPEALQGTPRTVQHDAIETSYETTLSPPPKNEVDDLPNFVSQAVKHTSKGKEVLPYTPTEDIISSLKNALGPDDQESPQRLNPSQSVWGAPTHIQPYELPTHELQSQSQTPVNHGQITILDPGMAQYDTFQDAKASSGESADYLEDVHHFSYPGTSEKLPSEHPFSNVYVLLEHGPQGTDPNSQTLEARDLGRSRTHLVSDPLSNYQQRNAESHLSQSGSQMDVMYRSRDIMTGQEPHQYVPLSYPGQNDQFQSDHNLGQSFETLDSSVQSF